MGIESSIPKGQFELNFNGAPFPAEPRSEKPVAEAENDQFATMSEAELRNAIDGYDVTIRTCRHLGEANDPDTLKLEKLRMFAQQELDKRVTKNAQGEIEL